MDLFRAGSGASGCTAWLLSEVAGALCGVVKHYFMIVLKIYFVYY